MSTINLPSDGSTDKLSIKVPVKGATNWADTLKDDTFEKIATHNHAGSGTGDKISVLDLKERGSVDLVNTGGSFSSISAVLNLAGTGGRGAIIEYNVKDETTDFTQIGTLTAYFKDSSDYGVSDEFIGADIVDFQLDNSGILQYKSTASKKMHYYTRTIGVE